MLLLHEDLSLPRFDAEKVMHHKSTHCVACAITSRNKFVALAKVMWHNQSCTVWEVIKAKEVLPNRSVHAQG